ncbi:MAG TPA: hypothetical protein DCQ31_19500 [Bacteroidales bacterium]|nr:hypothetical protein [Bacteroidales bacterium]
MVFQKRKKMKHNWYNLFFAMASIMLTACGSDNFKIDTSNISLDLQVVRFEPLLFEVSPGSLPLVADSLAKAHPEFTEVYGAGVLLIGKPSDEIFDEGLQAFVTDYTMASVYETVKSEYSNFDQEIQTLIEAFKRYNYYFPQHKVPTVYTCTSGFNQSVFTSDSFVAVALDNYLGDSGAEYYDRLAIENYKRIKMRRERIPHDVITAWLMAEFEFTPLENNLAAQMLYYGKILYAADAIYPEMHDTIKFSYTPLQYNWAVEFENKVWSYLVENKTLFTGKTSEINKYIQDAPFTAPFMNNSAPRIGTFIGRQIIYQFMRHNPEYSIEMLMQENDYMKILNLSKYNP